MIHLIGYGALVLNLTSMAMKNIFLLRTLSLTANAVYIIYGLLLNAPPFIIGCSVAVVIHTYHLSKLRSKKEEPVISDC
ncbi:MAG: hypothetical protein ED557_12960 [Balneola sp.]|nr:MAG: hypothetical protein ED557_12960 [Balneola sp.]